MAGVSTRAIAWSPSTSSLSLNSIKGKSTTYIYLKRVKGAIRQNK
jgi:hypothetical protein